MKEKSSKFKKCLLRAQALVLVMFMIVAGSIAMAPAVLAAPQDSGNNPTVVTEIVGNFQIDVAQSTPAVCFAGSNIPVLQIDLTDLVGGGDVFNALTLTYTGTDPADVTFASLYRDDGDSTFNPLVDLMVGAPVPIAGVTFSWVAIGELVNPGAGLTQSYWVMIQTDALATVGNTVDALVPAAGIQLLVNGANVAPMDPNDAPDFCTIQSNIVPPQAIYGYVKQDDLVTPIAGVVVTVTEGATGFTLIDTTDGTGGYDVDLNDLVGGYTDGDTIICTIPNPGYNSTLLNTALPAQQVDVIVDTTVPTTVLSIVPDYNNTGTWNVDFTWADPLVTGYSSGVEFVELYVETPAGGGFNLFATQVDGAITGTEPYVPLAGEGIYSFYSLAIDYAGNNESAVKPLVAEDTINYDVTDPTAVVTGPATSNVAAFPVTYNFNDPLGVVPSGVVNVSLWWSDDGGNTWNYWGDDAATGTFNVDTAVLSGDGSYSWYTVAWDAADNSEPFPPTVPADVEFTTLVDSTSPFVVTTTPLDGAVGVALAAADFVIQFSEPMAPVGVATSDLPGVVWAWSANGYYYNGTYALLTESTTYNVDLSAGGFQDVLGNALIQGGYDWTFDFTTLGVNPEVVTTTPLDGAVGVALAAADFVIQFSEPMAPVGVATSDLPGVVWAWSANGYYYNGTYALLTESTTYNVDLSAGGFQDVFGNPLVQGGYDWIFDFTTLGVNPEVVTTTPLDGAIGIALAAADFVIEFNEPMAPVGVATSDLPGVVWAWSANGYYYNGTYALLTESTTYNVDLSAGGFQDVLGNALIQGGYDWTFDFTTVGVEPVISLTAPFDGETGVLLNTDIVITFSEEMNPATFTYLINPDPGGWTVTWNGPANDQVTLSHTDFNGFMVYTFTVTAAEDVFGNGIVAGPVPNPWSFETIGTFNLNLVAGWNLFCIPVLNPTVGGVPLATADDIASQGALMVSSWNFASQGYTNYIAGFHTAVDPQNFALQPDEAYWAWMPGATVIPIVGEHPGLRALNVDGPGWNMVGYMNPVTPGDVETDWAPSVSCGAYDDIAYYNAGAFTHYIFAGTVMALTPGLGYFVWSDAPAVINYGVAPPASVLNTNSGISYGTIQAAIDVANAGDILEVQPGIYAENLLVHQEVEITALGAVTIIGSHTVTASNVIFDPITFETTGTAVTIDATGGAIDNVQFLDCIFELPSPGGGIWIGDPASSNLISNVIVDGCTFNGPGSMIANPIKIGGQFGSPTSQPVTNLYFQNNDVNYCSAPINLHDADLTNLVFDGNTFRNTDGGVYVWGDGAPTGLLSGFTFTNNDMDNTNSYGIGFGVMGVLADANFDFASIQIHNNSFDNIPGAYGIGGVSMLGSGITGDIDARWNWWGDASGPYHATYNPVGLGSEVSDHVLFDPFWTDAGMTTTGSLPIKSQNNGMSYTTIQDAIDDVSPGDTLLVSAGTYTEDLLVDKGVKITAVGSVTIVGSHTITAGDVIFDPITFDTSGTTVTIDASGGAIDNVQFLDCTFNLPSPGGGIWIGNPASANLISNVIVDGCIFNGPGDMVANPVKIGGNYGSPASQPVTNFYFQNNEVYRCSMNFNMQDADFTNFVFDNNLFRNTDGLMYFWGEGAKGTLLGTLDGFTFTNNDADATNTYGIGFDHDPAFFGVQPFTDVYTDANFNFASMLVNDNSFDNIVGNYGFDGAVFIVSSGLTGDIDARWNWWGDPSGPTHVTNPPGIGSAVSDHVLFTQWWADTAMTIPGP